MKSSKNPNRKWWPQTPSSWSDWEITSILFGRPLAALLLFPVRFVINPNLVTSLSLILSLGAVPVLFSQTISSRIIASTLLFLSMVLDDGDGLVARFQNRSSAFGSFLDKSADVIRFGILFPLFGYLGYKSSQDPIVLLLGGAAPFGLMVQGYSKWLFKSFDQEHSPAKSNQKSSSVPNKKVVILKGILNSIIWPFHECDLTMWMIVFILLGKISPLVYILSVSQLLAGFAALIGRTWMAYKIDKNQNVSS